MRGKKTDIGFVGDFISQCAASGKHSTEEICSEAERKIQDIDSKIREVEELKKVRSKLKDVINTLGTKIIDKSEDKKVLSFFQLSNQDTVFALCDLVKDVPVAVNKIDRKNSYLIKEMLSANILDRTVSDELVQGDCYQEFIDFYLLKFKK